MREFLLVTYFPLPCPYFPWEQHAVISTDQQRHWLLIWRGVGCFQAQELRTAHSVRGVLNPKGAF